MVHRVTIFHSRISDSPKNTTFAQEYTTSSIMAPSRVDDSSDDSNYLVRNDKATVYLIDTIHPDAIEYAKTKFNLIIPSDPECQHWRQKATSILVRGSYVTVDDIKRSPNLIAIGKQGVGIDKIDQTACAERRIAILNTPGANAQAVAEMVLALTMAVAREIRSIAMRQLLSVPLAKEQCSGQTIYGKTIGILGMGNIGKKVAEMFRGAFNAQIVAYDPFMAAGAWSDIKHRRVSTVDEVLEVADVLTIHVPLTTGTRDLISYKELSLMKRNAILINAARGGIVHEGDLKKALEDGLIWGAGLDCHEEEPPTREKYAGLWDNLNVVSTPHVGAATSDTQFITAKAAIDNLYKYLQTVA